MSIVTRTLIAACVACTTLALAPLPAQAQGRHGGYSHGYHGYRGGGWGPGLLWGGIGLGLGLGALTYAYGAPWYPGYTVAVPPPAYYPPPVTYYNGPPATYYNNPPPQAAQPPDPIFYPNKGQSPAQTESDRRACNRWATTQPSAMNDASVFQRATLACMDGRGYSAR